MAATTAPAHVRETNPRWREARARFTALIARTPHLAAQARARFRRPALHIGAFTAFDIAAWHTFGLGAGLLVLGALLLVWEFLGGDE